MEKRKAKRNGGRYKRSGWYLRGPPQWQYRQGRQTDHGQRDEHFRMYARRTTRNTYGSRAKVQEKLLPARLSVCLSVSVCVRVHIKHLFVFVGNTWCV